MALTYTNYEEVLEYLPSDDSSIISSDGRTKNENIQL